MERYRARGLELTFHRAGAGPPLVLLHGAAEDGRIWAPQLSGLADTFTVIAWDEPGTGGSDDVPDDFSLDDYADCVAGLIEHLGLGPVHLAGLSWGGTVAIAAHRRHPGLVASLVLVDTYAGWKGSLPAHEVLARVAGVRRMLAAPPSEFDPTLPGLFWQAPPAEYVPLLAAIAADVRPRTLSRQVDVMAGTDLTDALAAIRVPTLLVWGEHDVRSPLAVAHAFHDAVGGSELVIVPDAGHMSALEQPGRVNDAIRAFCLRRG